MPMQNIVPALVKNKYIFILNKRAILNQWLSYKSPREILKLHDINIDSFIDKYANGVFDYFMGVIAGEVEIGDCPVIHNLLSYLKDKDIKADELFEICSHFRRSMVDFTYDANLNSKELFDEISFLFDKNFQGVLRFYSDTIYQKEQEINRHVKLLNEYQKALDESAIVSKVNEKGIITYINDKYIKLSGYSQDELLGREYLSFIHSDMPKEYYNDMWFQLKNLGIFRGTLKNFKKNSEYYYIDVTIVKIVDPHDNTVEYMSIATDVTKLIDARLEAQMASQAKEYFLSNMSHEIRTPLNAILGFVDLLIEQDVSKQHRKYLEIILNSGENLLSIINDILDFSKLRSGEFMIEPKIFSIHDEISHTLELFVASANSKDITITSFIDPTIPRELFADILRIKQILSNFLSNAIKFTRGGGHIHVEVSCHNKVLKISVTDNGIGIAQDDLKNIFSAFTQVSHEGMENLHGTGLGLSICYQLSKLMGGEIFVSSAIGVGSVFWVEIPVEIYTSECQIFNNINEIKNLKVIFYQKNSSIDYRVESFLKYSKIFNINIDISYDFNCQYDVAVILDDELDDNIMKKVSIPDKKYIILASVPSDKYDKYSNIVCVGFPLYCSKIKGAFDELLHPENLNNNRKQKDSKKYRGHILIVEDNEANQELIKILLDKYGLTYDLASNGLEALNLFKMKNYDLILMDEQMPIMDGNEAVKYILKYEKDRGLRHTPISALTANVIKGAKERGLKSGFDSFLGKPIVIKELERVFANYLKADHKMVDATSSFCGLTSIDGLNCQELKEELMLSEDELLMLIELFIKKMSKQLPELEEIIKEKNFKKIASIAHSIKGSSANFRIEELQAEAAKMEKMAKKEDLNFDYIASYKKLKNRIEQIKVNK